MTTVPTSSSPIHLPDVLPEYPPVLDAKLKKLAKAGYIQLAEPTTTKENQ